MSKLKLYKYIFLTIYIYEAAKWINKTKVLVMIEGIDMGSPYICTLAAHT